jgi:ribose transport system substrate-binding protein
MAFRFAGRLTPNLLKALLALIIVGGALLAWKLLSVPQGDENATIDVIFKSTDPSIVFWQIVKAGAETAARDFDVKVHVMGPKLEKDVAGQIKMVRFVIGEHPSAIVLAADDYDALVPVAQSIRKAGIKLVTIDSGLNGGLSSSFIATDNEAAGEKAGELAASLLDDNGSVAIVSYVKGTLTAIERERGIREVLQRYPGLSVVGTYYCDDLAGKAYDLTKQILLRYPNLRAILALNEVATVGAANALSDLHEKEHVDLIGFDNSPVEFRYLEAGVIRGIVLQKPFNMGYLGVEAAVRLLKGKPVEKRVDTGSLLVTKQNMYDRESQKLLFPLVDGESP